MLSLDWSDGACTNGIPGINSLEYPLAVANTREVGEYMAKYISFFLNILHVIISIQYIRDSDTKTICVIFIIIDK